MTSAPDKKGELFGWSVCCFSAFTPLNGFGNVEGPILIVVKLFCFDSRMRAFADTQAPLSGELTEKVEFATFVETVSGNGGLVDKKW